MQAWHSFVEVDLDGERCRDTAVLPPQHETTRHAVEATPVRLAGKLAEFVVIGIGLRRLRGTLRQVPGRVTDSYGDGPRRALLEKTSLVEVQRSIGGDTAV